MNPPDFCIDYRHRGKIILKCWEVRYILSPEAAECRFGSEQIFDDYFKTLFTQSMRFQPSVLQLSNFIIKRSIRGRLRDLDVDKWARNLDFQITRGESHPDEWMRYSKNLICPS